MRASITFVLLGITGGVASAAPCEVTIARAPAEVRTAIETALSAEAHCSAARASRDRDRRRVLRARARHARPSPRARRAHPESAATLVTSWAADDEIVASKPEPLIVAEPHVDLVAPAMAAVALADRPSFIALYGAAGASGAGLRGEADLCRQHRWSLGVAAMWLHGGGIANFAPADIGEPWLGTVVTEELDLFGYVSYERDLGQAWHLRGSVGAGVSFVDTALSISGEAFIIPQRSGASVTALSDMGFLDASLVLVADLAGSFSLVGGVFADSYIQPPEITLATSEENLSYQIDRSLSVSVLLGLRYGL